jgi:hypothetical protein
VGTREDEKKNSVTVNFMTIAYSLMIIIAHLSILYCMALVSPSTRRSSHQPCWYHQGQQTVMHKAGVALNSALMNIPLDTALIGRGRYLRRRQGNLLSHQSVENRGQRQIRSWAAFNSITI